MLTLLMWREVQPMGFVTNYCLHPGLQALLAFSSRREALTPIGAVEVLGDFDLAAGPHVEACIYCHTCRSLPVFCSTSLLFVTA